MNTSQKILRVTLKKFRMPLLCASVIFAGCIAPMFASSATAQTNAPPTKFSRSFDIKNTKAGNYANNEDFQRVVNTKNRQQRGDNPSNRRGRRNQQQGLENDDRTQSETRLSQTTARQTRNQNRARNNTSGRRGAQAAKPDNSSAGIND